MYNSLWWLEVQLPNMFTSSKLQRTSIPNLPCKTSSAKLLPKHVESGPRSSRNQAKWVKWIKAQAMIWPLEGVIIPMRPEATKKIEIRTPSGVACSSKYPISRLERQEHEQRRVGFRKIPWVDWWWDPHVTLAKTSILLKAKVTPTKITKVYQETTKAKIPASWHVISSHLSACAAYCFSSFCHEHTKPQKIAQPPSKPPPNWLQTEALLHRNLLGTRQSTICCLLWEVLPEGGQQCVDMHLGARAKWSPVQ